MTVDPIRVLTLLRERAPDRRWSTKRVVHALQDFPDADQAAVAGRCADWLLSHPDAKDGPKTLRRFLEEDRRERRKLLPPEVPEGGAPSTRFGPCLGGCGKRVDWMRDMGRCPECLAKLDQ